MTDCSIIQDGLLFYLLGELSPEEMMEVGQHLQGCPSCTGKTNALAADVMKIRSAFTAVPNGLDRSFSDRIVAQLPASRPSKRYRWPSAVAALATCLVIAILTASFWRHGYQTRTVAVAGLLADHLEYLNKPNPTQITSADPHTVADWLSDRVGFRVSAVDLSRKGAALLGGRRCELNGVPLAFLFYEKGGTRISVYEIQGARVQLDALLSRMCNGHKFYVRQYGNTRLVACRSGNSTLVVVSDLNEDELIQIAQAVAM